MEETSAPCDGGEPCQCKPEAPIFTPAQHKATLITWNKSRRRDLDEQLQSIKALKSDMIKNSSAEIMEDAGEAIAQTTLAQRACEEAMMRLGMALKYIGNPSPYPNSKDPSNTIVEPTADGLKM